MYYDTDVLHIAVYKSACSSDAMCKQKGGDNYKCDEKFCSCVDNSYLVDNVCVMGKKLKNNWIIGGTALVGSCISSYTNVELTSV